MSDPNAPQGVPPQQPPTTPPVQQPPAQPPVQQPPAQPPVQQPPAQPPVQQPAPVQPPAQQPPAQQPPAQPAYAPQPTQPMPQQPAQQWAPNPAQPQPGYAGPPGGPPMGPMPTGTPGGNFKSSKGKVIGLIVGGVVAIGILGGIGAVVLSGSDDGDKVQTASPGGDGDGILHPSPVGNTTPPSPTPTTEAPTETPTETTVPSPTPTEAPTPTEVPTPTGDTVTIGSDVLITVPDGWEVIGDVGDNSVYLGDGDGSFVFALTGTDDPSADAASIISANLDIVLPPDYYNVQTSDITPAETFGSVVSFAVMDYKGQLVDSQGSKAIYGQIYAGVRQDGTVLIINPEHSPPKDYGSSSDSWAEVLNAAFNQFAS